jgi:hypothetical protein
MIAKGKYDEILCRPKSWAGTERGYKKMNSLIGKRKNADGDQESENSQNESFDSSLNASLAPINDGPVPKKERPEFVPELEINKVISPFKPLPTKIHPMSSDLTMKEYI